MKLKKLVAGMVSAMMVATTSISVFAADTNTTSVDVSIQYQTVKFVDGQEEPVKGTKHTIRTTVDDVKLPTTENDKIVKTSVYSVVDSALKDGEWVDSETGDEVKVEGITGTKDNGDGTTSPILAGWVGAKDYYNPSVVHKALDSVSIGDVVYGTIISNTTQAYRGSGWTYSGESGAGSFNEYNYMDDNYIEGNGASVELVYSAYSYDK